MDLGLIFAVWIRSIGIVSARCCIQYKGVAILNLATSYNGEDLPNVPSDGCWVVADALRDAANK